MKQLLFAITVLFALSSYGQDELQIEDRRLAADKVFGALRPNLYGGRLLDRTFSDFEPTLQQRRGNYQQIHDAYTFIGLYSDVALSYVDPNAMLDNEELVQMISQTFGRYEMESEEDLLVQPFGLLLHNLKQIDSSYYDSTYFTSNNYQFIPKVNESSLYKDVKIKSAALLEFYGDNGYTEGVLKYNEAFISTSPDIRIIQIKLDVGRGFEDFGPSNPELTYSRMGDYIKGRVALSYYLNNSIVLDTLTFYLTTIGEKNDLSRGRDGWDDKGTYVGAYGIDLRWGIKFGCGNREGIRRPFIIAPPYRPKVQSFSLQKYYDQFNFKSMISSLADMGYDVIFIKEKPGNGSIEDAGKTIADFIVAVNATKKVYYPDEDWENIVMGFSAGGQHLRYALKYLEKRHMDWNTPHHHTRLYIPFDSPHWGANIPMFTQTVYMDKKGMNVFAALANESLVDEGSKDMAVTHYYASNVSQVGNSNVYMMYPGPCSERQNLVNALNNDFNHQFTPLNDLRKSFPSFTRNVSIATGRSDINYRAEYGLQPGMLLFSQDNVGLGIGGVQYKNRKLYASKYGASPTIFRNLEKILTFLFPITIRNRDYRIAYANEWDLAQGGYKDEFYTGYAIGIVPIGAIPILQSGFFGGSQQFYYNHVSFMPVVSALAINPSLWQNNQLLYNLKTKGLMYKSVQDYTSGVTSNTFGYPNLAHPSTHFSITPFEAVYSDIQTYEHIKMQESVYNDYLDDVYLVHTRNFVLDEVEADINCLQNQIVGNNHNQWASGYKYRAWYRAYDKIMIGYNVTPKTDPGDYVIKKTGVITVHAGKEVNIKPGFHAQVGSDFHAFIEYSCSRPRSKSMENDDNVTNAQESENVPAAEMFMETEENMMLVYPNPAHGNFTVRVSENYIGGVYSIYDLYGKEMLAGNIRTLESQIDARLSKGVYLIRVTNNGNAKTQKIVID